MGRLVPALWQDIVAACRRVEALRAQFPHDAGASAQADWIRDCYDHDGAPPSLLLITLLLFEHGSHRSIDQVACDLAMLRRDADTNEPR